MAEGNYSALYLRSAFRHNFVDTFKDKSLFTIMQIKVKMHVFILYI